MMNPRIRAGATPPFHELGEYVFQELCRDLFFVERDITTCDIYGTRGQSQKGIDLLARRTDGNGIEVGQCKCFVRITPAAIQKASDDFFAFWDHWSEQGVKRFILFVACDFDQRQNQEAIDKQIRDFRQYGITYESWSAAMIRNKLRPHPGIVANYCSPDDHWIKIICGTFPATYAPTGSHATGMISAVSMALAGQVEDLATLVSRETEQGLERIREAWREGRKGEAIKWLREVKGDSSLWHVLAPSVQSKLLRIEAGLELDLTGGIGRAKQLADEARNLAPSDNEARLQALIAYKEIGPEPAAELLVDQKDIDSLNFRAALLLVMGRVDECRQVSDAEGAGLEPNAETFRVRALLHLMDKDLTRARLAISKALEMAPRWESIRFTAAMIDYFSSLSPAALPGELVPWPVPVDWTLIKRDDESFLRRRKAGEEFRQLAQAASTRREERRSLEAWCLACLANDPECQREAIEYCRSILQADRTHYPVIAWTVARNFDIDLKPSELALSQAVAGREPAVPLIIALVNCHLASGKTKRAIRLLNESRTIFEEQHAELLWTLWLAQSLVAGGRPKAAVAAIDESGLATELAQVRTMALRVLARVTGDWRSLTEHLEASYTKTGEPSSLLDCCEVMAAQRNWAYVADRAEQLVEELGTADALRLGAIAAYNAKRFNLCLELLNSRQDLFMGHRLPSELRRMRVQCHYALGILPQAIADAEDLAREEPTVENLLALARLYSQKGDFKLLATVARKMDNQPALSTHDLLWLASSIQWEDQRLAKSLWRQAVRDGLPDDAVGTATILGHQLALEEELAPLLQRMADLARQGRGGVQLATIQDVISLSRSRYEHMQKLYDMYQTGTIPVHLIAGQGNWPLVDLYHAALAENETKPGVMQQFHLLARHGGRGPAIGFADGTPEWHLSLDITAVLLAAHLSILESVESTFRPLHIPADLVRALVQMRERVTHPQPGRLEDCQQVIDLAERGSLRVVSCTLPPDYENRQLVDELGEQWVALFETARMCGGYVVDFLPLTTRDLSTSPSALPQEANDHLATCRSVLDALRQQGPLSEEEYVSALSALGSTGHETIAAAIPKEGSALYCHANIPRVLASAKLLGIVCQRFQVYIEQREIDQAREELRSYQRMRGEAAWLDDLISRLSTGIDNGTYQIIPIPADVSNGLVDAVRENPDLGCILTLLRFETAPGDVVWADDRWTNSYASAAGTPIVDITEVLKALVSINALSPADYYGKLSRLRASNVLFVPIEENEILYHLRQSRVDNGVVMETQALTILRRYVATCFLHGNILQRPPIPPSAPNQAGEISFVLGLAMTVAHAIGGVWATEENDDSICRAYADWLFANLYVDFGGLFRLTALLRPDHDDLQLLATSLLELVTRSLTLESGSGDGRPSARQRYLGWLFDRVLQVRFNANPYLVMTVADTLKKIISSVREQALAVDPGPAAAVVLQAFFEDLPEPIRDELGHDLDFMASIGIKVLTTANVDDLKFGADDFWKAAADAINGRQAKIIPINSNVEVIFQPLEDRGLVGFQLDHPTTGITRVVAGDDFGLLIESPTERELFLRRNRIWFDCESERFEHVVGEIASTEDPRRRIEEARVWRNSSAAAYYETLHRKLAGQQHFQFPELLPPSGDGLLRHFRLTSEVGPGVAFHEALAAAARTLANEENLTMTIERLIGLPVPLPATLVEAVAGLRADGKRRLIKQLLKADLSPVSMIHFVHLLLRLGDDVPACHRLARRIVLSVFSSERVADCEAFLAILRWTNDEFAVWPDACKWAPQVRLAMTWAHAHRLFSSFISAGAPVMWVRDTFTKSGKAISPDMLQRDADHWFDIAHPRQVSRLTFLFAGVAYSLSQKPAFCDEKLRDLFTTEAFQQVEGRRLPVLSLLRDPTLAQNSLGSFLGGDRGEKLSLLLTPEDSTGFERSSLEALVKHALSKLADGSDELFSWALLHAVLGDLPPYKELAEQLATVIGQADFVRLFEKDSEGSALAIRIASSQAINLEREDVCGHLREQLVKIANSLGNQPHSETNGAAVNEDDSRKEIWICVTLLETALNIAVAGRRPPEDVMTEFGELVKQLADAWRPILAVSEPIVQLLHDGLPVSQAEKLWPLLIRLRAA